MQEILDRLLPQMANRWLLMVWCALVGGTSLGQSSTHLLAIAEVDTATRSPAQVIVAEPKQQGASPFSPSVNGDVRLPVTVNGFCIVTLRERQEWLLGSEANQLVFDGQLYWFVSQRERAMFAAAPRRYVPALGSNCVVSFAEVGVRRRGNPQYGILHDQRLFFFHGLAERQKFQSNPDQYAKIDLASDGNCLVSQLDEQHRTLGLPETTVIVEGLRYRFAGVHQQRKFLANMRDYGVTVPETPQLDENYIKPSSRPPQVLTAESSPSRNKLGKSNKLRDKKTAAAVTNMAMGGYCPVSIRDAGIWATGDRRYRVEFDGLTYLLAGVDEQKRFSENPSEYLPALGGNCVVTEMDENRRVPGSIYHASQYEGRLYLFAAAEQKRIFDTTTPEKYANADLVAAGTCIVSLLDESRTVAGLPELLIWHRGKRYLFASAQQQATFRENTERYQDR